MQHSQTDGEILRAFITILTLKNANRPRLIVVITSNKIKDWIIRSQAPKVVKNNHGEGSETTCEWVK